MELKDLFDQVKTFLGLGESATLSEAHDGLLKLGTLAALSDQVKGELKTGVEDAQTGIENLKQMVADANTKLGEMATTISGLETKLTAAETAVGEKATSITNLETKVTALEGKVTSLATELATVKAGKAPVVKTGEEGLITPKDPVVSEGGIKVVPVPGLSNLVFPTGN